MNNQDSYFFSSHSALRRIVLLTIVVCCPFITQAQLTLPASGGNQKGTVAQSMGLAEVKITYSSPRVHTPHGDDRKGRIWGQLVPYGFVDPRGLASTSKAAPWRAGANDNTTISFSHDVQVNGKAIAAGTYGLFLAVYKDQPWVWIFSKNSTSWGAFSYDPAEDVLRVEATPQDVPDTEYLTYGFDDRMDNSASVFLQWENKKVAFKVVVPNMDDLYVANLRNELRSTPALDYHSWLAAARFCSEKKINLDEALTWSANSMDKRYGGVTDFSTLSVKASLLTEKGNTQEADKIMAEAVRSQGATMEAVHQYGRSLLNKGKAQEALDIFIFNAKQHPEEKFMTIAGLARGYTAVGNKKEAIKNWEIAIKNAPESQKQNIPTYQAEIEKLKSAK